MPDIDWDEVAEEADSQPRTVLIKALHDTEDVRAVLVVMVKGPEHLADEIFFDSHGSRFEIMGMLEWVKESLLSGDALDGAS